MIALIVLAVLFYLSLTILMIVSQWKIYQKAGFEGWECIIPFYNLYILTKIIGKPSWWMLLIFIPIANIVFIVWMVNLLSKSFGKSEGFTVGLIFLGFVFYPILAFGDATYIGPGGYSGRSIVDELNSGLDDLEKS
ncbi:DUF5684 domain-containing protein [Taibaiella soli]|uniref:DUF5684 domain-containing protein n=1 Tax=Taibaiella soli TaxID=1649169 RepID=UPI001A9E56C0|nr:DUF5684 domain-containing protein [Taibaiella soli]